MPPSIQAVQGGGKKPEESKNRLLINDKISGAEFLVDTGADVSVLPKKFSKTGNITDFKLFAANQSDIQTYGTRQLRMDFGLGRQIPWNFYVADVAQPILGGDIIKKHKLLVDLDGEALIDKRTGKVARGNLTELSSFGISSVEKNKKSYFEKIVDAYPELLGLAKPNKIIQTRVAHHIPTIGAPVNERPRRLSPEKYAATREELNFLLQAGIIRRSCSPWASPIHHVKKKDGSWRQVGDYRGLNNITRPDRYSIPHATDFANILFGTNIYTTLDLERAYQQIPVAEEDIEKTAFTTPFGSYEYLKMPYGLKSASQTFQRYIDEALSGLKFVFVYVDDILIASSSPEEHEKHLKMVFDRLKKYGLLINKQKCVFGQTEVKYLGYLVNSKGVAPLPDKVKAVQEFPKPKTVMELQRFLGMVNFYRRSLPHAAEDQIPFSEIIANSKKKDKTPIKWTPALEEAFQKCKDKLAKASLLTHPSPTGKVRLITDASEIAIGAALEQKENNGPWEPLAFFSRKLKPAQIKYSAYDRELKAIYESVRNFRHWLEAIDFEIYTDQQALVYAFNQKSDKTTPRQTRYLDFISQYSTKIIHIEGKENVVADALSRINAIQMPTAFEFDELSQEQQKDKELQDFVKSKSTSCKFAELKWGKNQSKIILETSTENSRPFIPKSLTRRAFDQVHRLSHPSGKATYRMLQQRYFWPNMRKQSADWAKTCQDCQQSKISRHVKNKLGSFKTPEARFDHIHIDIIGPMPESQGYKYCLTVIDRFSRWPEAFPIMDMTAESVSQALYNGWICRYGTPLVVTTDQGSQFESTLFKALLKMVGAERRRTTAYHPAANGLIERLHRTLKSAIMCIGSKTNWVDLLPTVMLGLRTCLREDVLASPAEYVFGKTVRLPGEFFSFGEFNPNPQIFLENYREHMKEVQPIPAAHHHKLKPFVFKDLPNSTHVWLRREDAESLDRPYEGPYKVTQRKSDLDYVIQRNGSEITVTTERLKPAFLEKAIVDFASQNAPSMGSACQDNIPVVPNSGGTSSKSQTQQKVTKNKGIDVSNKQVVYTDHSYSKNIPSKSILKKPSNQKTATSPSNKTIVTPLLIPLRTYPAKKKVSFPKPTVQIIYVQKIYKKSDFYQRKK